jgi:D-aminopeptidase
MNRLLPAAVLTIAALCPEPLMAQQNERPRARDAGVIVGVFEPGTHNAITDVAGVRVGHTTVREGTRVNTGITAILPHGGNLFRERVPAAIVVGNGFGKLVGITQVRELGELETPILLTCTLCVWRAADAMTEWLIAQPGMADVRSINPVVGETNDGGLNDIRSRPITAAHVTAALEGAATGPVEEGSVGAGAGTVAFGWKGGIGTSSRVLPEEYGGHTVGVLVQSNYGGILTINGAPVGRELGRYSFQRAAGDGTARPAGDPAVAAYTHPAGGGSANASSLHAAAAADPSPDGSIMIVVATDAPLDARNLERLATRALVGLARTGSSMTNGSGDYVIAFSTAEDVRRTPARGARTVAELPNDAISPLFQAVAEATEEAIYNSLFRATTVQGERSTVEALPLDRVMEILRRHNALRP